jgi:hypothetical protein
MVNNGLQELLQKFKASGTGAQMYDTLNDTTKGYIDILAASATMKVNLSGLTVTEASPGVLSFSVAAGTEGNEVEFEAMTIEGSDAISTVADINFKQGALTYWENSTGKIWLRAPNAGNLTVLLPSSSGTIALTTDIPNVPVDSVNGQTGVVILDTGDIDENGNLYYTEARVAANSAVAANTAKVGITTQQASDITANNAKVGITPTQASEITANTAKVGVIAGGTTGQALVKASGTDYDTEWADIAIDTQYHNRFQTDAETFRSGATDTVELYYTAKADGDGLAESASSDIPTAGKVIKRKIYYSEAAFADPDTGTWVEFTPAPADDASFATVKAALLEYLKARTGGTVPISLKQTWEEVTAAPAFTGLLNETYGSGAEAAYSTRRLNGNVTDCMIIRRASDSTTTTIGFDSEGNISEADIESFCTGTTCTVYQWLDQSGNGNTATAPSTGEEPTIYTGGALVKLNGKTALLGTSVTGFTLNSLIDYVQPNDTPSFFFHGMTTSATSYYTDSTSTRLYLLKNAPTYIAAQTFAITRNGTSSSVAVVNERELLSFISSQSRGFDVNRIFIKGNVNVQGYTGYYNEAIFYKTNKSSVRTDIEENIGDYFTQNTPLLDTYTGAAAAYSLRKLRTAYTGAAVEVYNGSSYADIGFNVFSELDTVALAAHCGSNSGYVSKWYSQTGSNDATQTNTANMPKIYDGTTGVVTENGKPAVEFDGSDDVLQTLNIGTNQVAESTIYSVFHKISGEGGVLNWTGSNVLVNTIRYTTSLSGYRFGWSSSSVGTDTGAQLLFTGQQDGANGIMNIDGTSQGTFTVDTNRYWDNIIYIGKPPWLSSPQMKMSEFVMYWSVNSASEISGIESNIATFYDITI